MVYALSSVLSFTTFCGSSSPKSDVSASESNFFEAVMLVAFPSSDVTLLVLILREVSLSQVSQRCVSAYSFIFSPISYTLLPVIYFFLLIAHTTIPMIISSIGTAIIMISPVITACSVFIVILLKL